MKTFTKKREFITKFLKFALDTFLMRKIKMSATIEALNNAEMI